MDLYRTHRCCGYGFPQSCFAEAASGPMIDQDRGMTTDRSCCEVRAFTVSQSALLGLSRRQIARSHYQRPFSGIRATADASEQEIVEALLKQLPDGAFLMAETAARYWRMPLPERLIRSAYAIPRVGVVRGQPYIRRKGVVGRSITAVPDDVLALDGVAVTSPSRTWLDLSAEFSLEELVAFTDALLGWGPGTPVRSNWPRSASVSPGPKEPGTDAGLLNLRTRAPSPGWNL